jgi:lysozyme
MKVRKACDEAVDLIKRWEGFRSKPYYCAAGKLTIGYGHLVTLGEKKEFEDGITEDMAEELLRKDLIVAELGVQKYTDTELSDLQHGALVSFTFNLGAGALQRSTLRSKLNRGEYLDAADEFPKWCWAGGRKLKGLLRRRLDEQEMFLAGTIQNGSGDDNGS